MTPAELREHVEVAVDEAMARYNMRPVPVRGLSDTVAIQLSAIRRIADAAIAAIREAGWRKVSEGWKIVPIEPDGRQCERGCESSVMPIEWDDFSDPCDASEMAADIYKAMVTVSPEPPEEG